MIGMGEGPSGRHRGTGDSWNRCIGDLNSVAKVLTGKKVLEGMAMKRA